MWSQWLGTVLVFSLAAGVVLRPPLDTPGAIRRGGFPVEEHQVLTQDGYILTLFRIPAPGGPPVFLQHGLACTSRIWVSLRRPLGFLLAAQGYDVWLGNSRGNIYSNQHTTYNVSQKEYWDFSWHEMGLYDLPAIFEHIIEQNGRKKILYVGHSMGITMLMVLLSIKPEYNELISYVFALAPAVFMAEMRSVPLNFVCTVYAPYGLELAGPQTWWPGLEEVDNFLWERCAPGRSLTKLCNTMYNLFAGPSTEIKLSFLPEIFSELPSTTSLKTFGHFGLNERGEGFRAYPDQQVNIPNALGPLGEYQLRRVKVPVALFYSDDDYAVHPKNVERLNNTLPRAEFLYKIPKFGFNHLDFLYGVNAERFVYQRILKILNNLKMNNYKEKR